MNRVNKQLQQYADDVAHEVKSFTMALVNMIHDNNVTVLDKDGMPISYKVFETAVDKLTQSIRSIPKERRRLVKENYPKKMGGFANPVFVKDCMMNFLEEVDLGDCYDENGQSLGPLKDRLKNLMTYGLTTTGILTSVFSIYRQLTHNYDPDDKNYTIPTAEMTKHFINEFSEIAEKDRSDSSRKDKFEVNRFRTARLRTLFNYCIETDISAEEKESAEKKVEELKQEQQYAKLTLAHLRRQYSTK